MRKVMCLLLSLLLLLPLALTGCGSKNGAEASQTNGNQPNPDRQGQYVRADLMGEVESIKDNLVTLKIILLPENNRNRGQESNNEQRNNNQNSQNGNQNNNTYNNNNGQDQNSAQPGNRQGTNRPQKGNRARNYTGETKTITISSDIPITTMVMGDNGPEQQKVVVKDIKKGDILQIWYSDKEKSTISRVSIGGFGGFGGNGFNRGNRNGGYNNTNNNK